VQLNGGTIFFDHTTSFMFIRKQALHTAGKTIKSKVAFEKFAQEFGHKAIVPFGSKEFLDHISLCNLTLNFSSTGANHQKGVAERGIQTFKQLHTGLLLCFYIIPHWPAQVNLQLWPFPMGACSLHLEQPYTQRFDALAYGTLLKFLHGKL
jgi:hypothetical protein